MNQLNLHPLNLPLLNLDANFSYSDAFYELLTELHKSRDDIDSQRVNARLILLLANHIGEQTILEQAMNIASE